MTRIYKSMADMKREKHNNPPKPPATGILWFRSITTEATTMLYSMCVLAVLPLAKSAP